MSKQIIGLDIGRSHTKVYTECCGEKISAIFQSVIGEGRESETIELKGYKDPIYLTYDNELLFVGELAEKESHHQTRNSSDDKTTPTAEILLVAALEKVAIKDKVTINLGVPYRSFSAKTLKKVKDKYEGKRINVKNNLTGTTKSILIENINIMRESDAALMYAINLIPNKDVPIGMVNIGFKTMEYSYFAKNFQYRDSLSGTEEYGVTNMLKPIYDELTSKGISKSLNEIDSSDDYDDKKARNYKFGAEKIRQLICEKWTNATEMRIYVSGGIASSLDMGDDFIIVENPQMSTAIGLFLVANIK